MAEDGVVTGHRTAIKVSLEAAEATPPADAATAPVRLTSTVKKGGCAAKIAAGTLSRLVRSLPVSTHPDLLVGAEHLDDAAVWRLTPELALIQTLDFFTPILDDPRDFGAVAAANAISDVFAMGGRPLSAMTILAYPLGMLPDSVLTELMEGAAEVIEEAGAVLVGGHSIEDDTLKFGFSVAGVAHPDRLWTNAGARPGDVVLLTKAIGTGTLSAALKAGEVGTAALREAVASMRQVNRSELPDDLHAAVRAATDVTGFGLLGHALHVARASGVAIRIHPGSVPLLPGAREALAGGSLTRAHRTNGEYVAEVVEGRDALDEVAWLTLVDPQTSGGLFLCVAPERADAVAAHLAARFPRTSRIGVVEELGSGRPLRLA